MILSAKHIAHLFPGIIKPNRYHRKCKDRVIKMAKTFVMIAFKMYCIAFAFPKMNEGKCGIIEKTFFKKEEHTKKLGQRHGMLV